MDQVVATKMQPQNKLSLNLDLAFNYAFTAQQDAQLGFLKIRGMSGWRYRLLMNRLVHLLEPTSYLEVGSWKGSTLCSAIYNNKVQAVAIDNWSEFGGPKDEFLRNVSIYKNDDCNLDFIESDFRKVNYSSLGSFEIYLFDGPHAEVDQHDGIILALPSLADEFVLIIDDWNLPQVSLGTRRALKEANLAILHSIEIRTTVDGSVPKIHSEISEWHNGYFIAVLSKR